MTQVFARALMPEVLPDVLPEVVLMRDDIQRNLQWWLNSPEHAHYVDTLCAAQDFQSGNLAHAWSSAGHIGGHAYCHDNGHDKGPDDDETTQTLVMIDINSLPAEMRANLGATAEDADMASCDTAA